MPSRPKRPCRQPGCRALVTSGYCPEHQQEAQVRRNERPRESSTQRGYDYRWQKLRESFLSRHPLCEDCLERDIVTPATLPHHMQPIEQRPDLRLDESNLRALCRDCHEIREGRKRL
jgi:5-methylcytosine-specific restriction protein A